jgi:hypothetical protein
MEEYVKERKGMYMGEEDGGRKMEIKVLCDFGFGIEKMLEG